jgi:acyl-[acyl-carrier-protein]-phospholipid O-acyltransferase/long-chain-fatty-acid--[acyl-carrier-protein] ligase
MKNIDGRTVDPETRVVLDKNETGVLSFRGPNIFAGYLNNPEKTKEVFSDDGWFMTGDLGRMDEDGFLFIEGRLSRFSKVGGEMVSHESVEDVIAGLLSVDGHTSDDILCAVTGIEDGSKGECLVLLSTVAVNSKWLGDNLRNKGIPNLWIPKHIKKTEKIPILGTGKLDLRKLKELAEA